MISNLVGIAFCLLVLAAWFSLRREERLHVQRACRHRWVVDSLYGEGDYWYRRCERCGKQEPIDAPALHRQGHKPPAEGRR